MHSSAWKEDSGKLACGVLHISTPECPLGRAIRLRNATDRIQDVAVPDKVAKPCMKSGETPRMREPDLEQNSAELNPTMGPGPRLPNFRKPDSPNCVRMCVDVWRRPGE